MRADHPDWEYVQAARFWPGRPTKQPVAGVVQHYTAAGNGRALARWLSDADDPSVKVSAHIIIQRDGHVIQQVRFADRAWHAGEKMSKGMWLGKPQTVNANQFTIGIENSNYGVLVEDGNGGFRNAYGKRYRGPAPIRAVDHRGVLRWWEPYSEELIQANIGVLKRIVELYPDVARETVAGHSEVSPHRKKDPGPLFPHGYILNAVFGGVDELTSGGVTTPGGDPDDSDNFLDIAASRGDLTARYDPESEMCLVGDDDDDEEETEPGFNRS